jgi:hypothetical protein
LLALLFCRQTQLKVFAVQKGLTTKIDAMADASNPLTNPCLTDLNLANECIQADPKSCGCFVQPFLTTFPAEVETSFREVLASQNPDDPDFCQATNDNICE